MANDEGFNNKERVTIGHKYVLELLMHRERSAALHGTFSGCLDFLIARHR